jgi:bla regulator protein blaR1
MAAGIQIWPKLRGWRKLLLATAGVAAALTSAHPRTQSSSAQSEPPASGRPNFDAASIKRNTSGGQGMMIPIDLPGGHVSARNATLRFLISVAYKLPSLPRQIRVTLVGSPGWVDSEHFDIEAEVEDNPPTEEKRLMLQSLLADRFRLTVHHETRQLPAFALVLDKGGKPGPQLQPHSQYAKCLGPSDSYAAPQPALGFNDPPPVPCDNVTVVPGPFSSWKVAGVNVTLEYLASVLSYWQGIDRAMVDRTGLTGKYDVRLEYTPQIAGVEAEASAPPLIFTAVQQQLGLKLEATKAPVDVLVIDHVEEPSPN